MNNISIPLYVLFLLTILYYHCKLKESTESSAFCINYFPDLRNFNHPESLGFIYSSFAILELLKFKATASNNGILMVLLH